MNDSGRLMPVRLRAQPLMRLLVIPALAVRPGCCAGGSSSRDPSVSDDTSLTCSVGGLDTKTRPHRACGQESRIIPGFHGLALHVHMIPGVRITKETPYVAKEP